MFNTNPFPCLPTPAWYFELGQYGASATENTILDLWSDVHSFSVDLTFTVDPAFSLFEDAILGASAGLAGILSALGAADSFGSSISAVGNTNRHIVTANPIATAGEIQQSMNGVTVCGEYPIHTFGQNGGLVNIDFGQMASYGGVYAPYVDIESSNGFSSIEGAIVIGGIDFAGIGQISIYANDPLSDYVLGSIEVAERYSNITMSSYAAKANSVVTLQAKPGTTFSGFKNTVAVYLGSIQIPFTVNSPSGPSPSITLTIPSSGATSGQFLFITKTNSGQVNKFYAPDPIIMS